MKPLRSWLLLLAVSLLLLPALCNAQLLPSKLPGCWPAGLTPQRVATEWGFNWSSHGRWYWVICPAAEGKPESLVLLVSDWSITNAALGGRLDTVVNKTDKEQAALDSWKRNVLLPLTDPRFDAVMRDVVADLDARGIVLEKR